MVKGGSIIGAILGMGGTTAYFSGATDPSSIFGFLMRPSWGGSGYSSSSASNNEIDSLYKLVDLLTNLDCDAASGKEQVGQKPCLHPGFPPCQQAVAEVEGLRRDMHRSSSSGGVTVIHGSNGSSAIVTYGGIILVSSLGVAYLRGWKFSDFLYVTRAGMQKSMSSITSSVEGLTTRMNNVKQFMAAQVDHIKQRQEDTMKAQDELKGQLETVGHDVENTRTDVAEVHNDLNKLGDNMHLLQQQQSYTSEGIYILCSVVGDLMKNVNHKAQSTIELEKYLNRPQIKKMQGLEGLLGEDQGPRQLGGKIPRMSLLGAPSLNLDDASPDSEHPGPLRSKDPSRFSATSRWWGGARSGNLSTMSSGNLSRQNSGMP